MLFNKVGDVNCANNAISFILRAITCSALQLSVAGRHRFHPAESVYRRHLAHSLARRSRVIVWIKHVHQAPFSAVQWMRHRRAIIKPIERVNSGVSMDIDCGSERQATDSIRQSCNHQPWLSVSINLYSTRPTTLTTFTVCEIDTHVLCIHCGETWILRKNEIKRLEAFEMWMWRRMLKISWIEMSWTEYRTNDEVLELAEEQRTLMTTLI